MNKKIVLVFVSIFTGFFYGKAQPAVYMRPPKVIEEIALAKLSPIVVVSPDQQWMAELERSPLRSLAKMAQPELKLAGIRIHPQTFNRSRIAEYTGASLLRLKTKEKKEITGLPAGAVIVDVSFSPEADKLVLAVEEADGVYLYQAAFEDPQAHRLTDRSLNATNGIEIQWINNNELLTLLVPEDGRKVPEAPLVPSGPVILKSTGKAMPVRTYQDLLSNPYEEQLFTYYLTSQPARIRQGEVIMVGKPALYDRFSLSPDKSLLLVSEIQTPYSYQVPSYYFPHTYYISDLEGNKVQQLFDHPTIFLPTGYDVASAYPRSCGWRADKPATVYWVEAQDGGNPREKKVEYMDIVYQWDYPFDSSKKELFRTQSRYDGIQWGDDQLALIRESSRATRREKTWAFAPGTSAQPQLLFDLSQDDDYNNPGTPVTIRNPFDRWVLYTTKQHDELLMIAPGASPEGNRPYLSRFNLKTKTHTELWRSQAPYYESIVAIIDPAKRTFITSRQSVDEPANFFIRDLRRKKIDRVTNYPNPYPAMAGVAKEKISYKRADGINLTATVYLPAGYDKEKDGRLPVLMWAYPREYRSAADASQVRGSQYQFTTISYASPVYWVLRGYCVMDNVEMPIVSINGAEPNDNFIQQLTMNAEAAIREIHDRGIGDTARVAIGGHSYGAFMTANLLTNTKLFKAGIARSGAYNRTLTPFGFQAETRTYWEAPEVYNAMSPFMHADHLSGALLLVHGEMDNNSGTFPIQSERFFSAIKGHGGVAKYVVLPYESHGYAAKENILHLLYECDQWLEEYVKNAK
ncbi:MAG: prolyl oligopeptidase family serine peptidase [Massilibacteroides sp.]|nr:prolyl oligopeptidase family serine peptidase [Massilibacteroides sp.]